MIYDEPIRILNVFSTLNRGGSECLWMDVYRHIDRSKIQFDFVKHSNDKGYFEDEIIALGGRIYSAPRLYDINMATYKKWWRNHFINHPEHMIIHGHFFTISDVYFRIAKKHGRVTIGHSHCAPKSKVRFIDEPKWILTKRHVKGIEEVSDYCFACSVDAGTWVFPSKPFEVLNNAIEASKFRYNPDTRAKMREKLNIQNNFVVGMVGRIVRQKNPFGALDIFKSTYRKNNRAILLWLGETGKGTIYNETKEYAEKLGIRDKVIFMGCVDNVNEYLQAMDCFIFPSFYEGLGIAAVEAQTAGLPCILSNTVPKETILTDLCVSLPIDKCETWASEIIASESIDRTDRVQEITDKKFDIKEMTKWITDFYLGLQND